MDLILHRRAHVSVGAVRVATQMDGVEGRGADSPDGGVHLALRRLKSKCLKSSRRLIGSLRSLQDGAYIAGYCESLCKLTVVDARLHQDRS
jgi:hypothetical protein